MKLLFVTVLILAFVGTVASTVLPGAQTIITKKAFKYGQDAIRSELTKAFKESKVAKLFMYDNNAIKNMGFQEFSFKETSLKIDVPNQAVNLSIKIDSMVIKGEDSLLAEGYWFEPWGISCRLNTIQIDVTALVKDKTYDLSCTSAIAHTWDNTFGQELTKTENIPYHAAVGLNRELCGVVKNTISSLLTKLSNSLYYKAVFLDDFKIDYGYLHQPVVYKEFIIFHHVGKITQADSNFNTFTFSPVRNHVNSYNNKMLYYFVPQYVFDTFAASAYNHKYFDYEILKTKSAVNAQGYMQLTCPGKECIGSILNELKKNHPTGDINIGIKTTRRPTFEIKRGHGNVKMVISGLASLTTGRLKLLALEFKMEVVANIKIINGTLTATVKTNIITLTSRLGIDNARLKKLAGLASTHLVTPRLNMLGRRGLPLPLKGAPGINQAYNYFDDALLLVENLKNYTSNF